MPYTNESDSFLSKMGEASTASSASSAETSAESSFAGESPIRDQFAQLLADLSLRSGAGTRDPAYHERESPSLLKDRIFVRSSSENYVRLYTDDILWIKADGNYCDIVCEDRTHTVCSNLKQFEERLGLAQFMRVHRSYLVNLKHISEFGEFFILVNDEPIPIGRSHKEGLARLLKRF